MTLTTALLQIIAAFFATLSFAVLFNTEKKQLLIIGVIGALGWATYLTATHTGLSIVSASFLAGLTVSFSSRLMARHRQTPVTVFLVSGIIPIVPGAGMYNILYSVVIEDYTQATGHFFTTLQIAGSIALAILTINSLAKIYRKLFNQSA